MWKLDEGRPSPSDVSLLVYGLMDPSQSLHLILFLITCNICETSSKRSSFCPAGPRWHWMEVCPHQAVDELLWRGRHAAASIQHHPEPQVHLVPAHVAPQQALQERPTAWGGHAQMWKPQRVHGRRRRNFHCHSAWKQVTAFHIRNHFLAAGNSLI